jgi:membrane protein
MKIETIGKKLRNSFTILKHSVSDFTTNNPVNMAGTTAYFTTFSMAPILIIIIAVFGFFTDDATIRTKLFGELNTLIGHESTDLMQSAIDNYKITEKSGIGAIIGVVVFLISATTLFSVMQSSINYIWRVRVKSKLKQNVLKFLKDRLFSFGLILSLGLVLLVSLIVDATLSILRDFISSNLNPDFVLFFNIVNVVISLFVTASVFAIIYRFMPDVKVHWNASWFGAAVAVILFFLGKFIIGFIIGNSQLGMIYGAASSFVAILVWVYYVSIIFYFGVEVSHQYSKFYKHKNEPAKFAIPFEISADG